MNYSNLRHILRPIDNGYIHNFSIGKLYIIGFHTTILVKAKTNTDIQAYTIIQGYTIGPKVSPNDVVMCIEIPDKAPSQNSQNGHIVVLFKDCVGLLPATAIYYEVMS